VGCGTRVDEDDETAVEVEVMMLTEVEEPLPGTEVGTVTVLDNVVGVVGGAGQSFDAVE
jgi:hypothetical protein